MKFTQIIHLRLKLKMRIQTKCPICKSNDLQNLIQENVVGNGNNVFQERLENNNLLNYNEIVRDNPTIKKYVKRTYNLTIHQCLNCQHIFQTTVFNPDEEFEYHSLLFKGSNGTIDMIDDHFENAEIVLTELKAINNIFNFKNVLDVGASYGEFCFIAKSLKIKPYAYDICFDSNLILQNNSIDWFNDLESITKKFEVIRVSHVLSHIHNNLEDFIKKIISLLMDDGLIYFVDHELQNTKDLSIVKSPLLHVNIFSKKSLTLLINNFPELEEIENLPDINNMLFKCYRRKNVK